jgi:DNA polymerase III delta prime subunit
MNIEEIIKYFEERESLNSIGHAYLFSNVDYENIKDTLKNIICSVILKNNTELEDNPDIYFIEPDNNVIKKEKILELEEKLSKTSQIGESKLYIIKECEKLNSSAANCLLKTLEEPGKNIYSFLLTSNIDNVISTIKSRCQIIQCAVEDNEISSKEIIEKSICIIKVIEEIGVKSIAYKSNELYKAFEKDELKQILKTIELFYKDCLNKMY